jgi:hypothetical protein
MPNQTKVLGFIVAIVGTAIIGIEDAYARNVFLNGVDISSARHQQMENIALRIDGDGNIFIIAPHYQVNEESTYIPLSSWKQSPAAPKNKKPGPLAINGENLPSHPALSEPQKGDGGQTQKEVPKEGGKTPKGEGEDKKKDDN